MGKTMTLVALIATVATASAAPKHTPASRSADDVHITVTAGRGRLGFAALQISPELRRHFGAPADRGVLVDHVRAGSPAERAGLRVGDIIVDVDGDATSSAHDVLSAISDRKKGDIVTLDVMRDGRRQSLQATLEDDPSAATNFSFGTKAWPGTKGSPQLDPEDWPRFDMKMFGDADAERLLEETRKRLEELERRFEKLDGKRRDGKRT